MNMVPRYLIYALTVFVLFICGCKNKSEVVTPTVAKNGGRQLDANQELVLPTVTYHLVPFAKGMLDSLSIDQMTAVMKINRVDSQNIIHLDSLLIPDTWLTDLRLYSPFPARVKELDGIDKLICYSYAIEAFAAYQNGRLVRWGPVSMGKKSTQTPAGLFFTNWKTKKKISSFNDEWEMTWYFNLLNFSGVSMHQYAMPGYPASHSCVRLMEDDAIYFYSWCNQWVLDDKGAIAKHGTPVLIFGAYPFGERRPWRAMADDSKAAHISNEQLSAELAPYMQRITEEEAMRNIDPTGLVKNN